VAKNLKWVVVLHSVASRSLEENLKLARDRSGHGDIHRREFAFLLERMKSGVLCFSEVFTPILISLYPHKYELTELFRKYVVVSYKAARLTGTVQLVTEQLWEETLPHGTIEGDSVDSGKRVIEALSSEDEQTTDKFLLSIKHLHLAVTNFCSNVEQLKEQFKDNAEVNQLMDLLRPRIEQIEDTSSILYSYSKENVSASERNYGVRNPPREDAGVCNRSVSQPDSPISAIMPGLPSKSKAKSRKKWTWEASMCS